MAASLQEYYTASIREAYGSVETVLNAYPRTYITPERFAVGHYPFKGIYEMSPSYQITYRADSKDPKHIFVRVGQEQKTWYYRLGGQRYVLVEVSHRATADHERLNTERYIISKDGRIGQVSEDENGVQEIPFDQIDNRVGLISAVLERVKEQATTLHQLKPDDIVQTTSAHRKE